MTDQNKTIGDDIAFMRSLAEAGRDRPMVGGSILFAAGLIFGLGSLLVWYLASVLGMSGGVYSLVWIATFVLWMAALLVLLRRLPKSAGTLQAATGVAWSGVGWAIFFIAISLAVMSYRLEIPNLMIVFPSVLMALYGACWMVGAILLRTLWMRLVAAAAFGMAIVNAWFADGNTIWLIYGVSLLALLGLPGFVLMRQSRKAG